MALLLGAMPAGAGTRVALVIGNSAYQNVPYLPNPVNDAGDLTTSLKRLDFEVKTLVNARYDDMRRALIDFGQQARGAEFAFIFFAGHGIQIGGENWLIPVDAQLATDLNVANETIGLQSLTRAVSNTTRLGLVVLDACRNDPFRARMQSTNLSRAVDRGFSRVEPSDNVLVAYAARDGTTASDGTGRNSPFTQSLLRNIETPGLEVRFLFATVRDDVMASTRREQQPFVYGSLSKEMIYLKPPGTGQAVPENAPQSGNPDATVQAKDPAQSSKTANLEKVYGERFGTEKPYAERLGPTDKTGPPAGLQPRSQVAQRAVLYEEDPAEPKGKAYAGTVTWKTEPAKDASGKPGGLAMRADVDIPDRKFKVTVTLRRNVDMSLPASHTAELLFRLPSDFAGGSIENVPGFLMKSNEQAKGVPLAGIAVKVTHGFFLVGFSNVDADKSKNIQLLKERAWFDIPMVYANKRRAILAIEKGEPGERVSSQVFASWGQ